MPTAFEGHPVAQAVVLAFQLVSIAALSLMVTKRAPSWSSLRTIKWMRLIVFTLLVSSLLCIFTIALYLYGVGTNTRATCSASFLVIVLAFVTTKFALHCFLTERVHLVYQSESDVPRHRSWPYWILCVVFVVAAALLILCCTERTWDLTAEGICYIGYHRAVSYSIIAVLVVSEGGATVLFLIPIWRSSFTNARALAKRSSWTAAACVLSSLANYLYVPLNGSQAQAWIYGTTITADVVFNAVVMYFLTFPSSTFDTSLAPPISDSAAEHGSGSIPFHLALGSTLGGPKPGDHRNSAALRRGSGGRNSGDIYVLEVPGDREGTGPPTPTREDWEGPRAV